MCGYPSCSCLFWSLWQVLLCFQAEHEVDFRGGTTAYKVHARTWLNVRAEKIDAIRRVPVSWPFCMYPGASWICFIRCTETKGKRRLEGNYRKNWCFCWVLRAVKSQKLPLLVFGVKKTQIVQTDQWSNSHAWCEKFPFLPVKTLRLCFQLCWIVRITTWWGRWESHPIWRPGQTLQHQQGPADISQ